MRNKLLLILPITLLFFSNNLTAQTTTFNLQINSIITEYGTTLGPIVQQSIKEQWPTWEQVTDEDSDYQIKIKFINGLDAKQYIQKRNSSTQYIYQVKYLTPVYQAFVINKEGTTVLQKQYGGKQMIVPFGMEESYNSPVKLATGWRMNRDQFYTQEEQNHNNIYSFLIDFTAITDGFKKVVIEPIPTMPDDEPSLTTIKSKPLNETKEKTNPPNNNNNESKNSSVAENSTSTTPDNNTDTNASEKTTPPAPKEEDTKVVAANAAVDNPIEKPAPPPPSTKPKETPEEREARIARIEKEWAEMEKEDEERHKKPRVRYGRIGARLLVPNILGGHGEIVLPILNNRISIVGDFTQLSIGNIVDRFLDDDQEIGSDIKATYQYLSGGINFYFRKKYARGWYLGASYLKSSLNTEVTSDDAYVDGDIELEAAAIRLGLNLGRKTFLFGFEVGAGVPFSRLEGTVNVVEEGVITREVVDESVPVIPILNITLGVAL